MISVRLVIPGIFNLPSIFESSLPWKALYHTLVEKGHIPLTVAFHLHIKVKRVANGPRIEPCGAHSEIFSDSYIHKKRI